jgi:hypothetical protein
MQGVEVEHRMKFNVSASLLDELLRDLSLIRISPFLPQNRKIEEQFSAVFNPVHKCLTPTLTPCIRRQLA